MTIRRTEPADARAIKAIFEYEKAYSGTFQLPYPSLSLWESRLSNTTDNVYSYVALIDNEIVGSLGFTLNLAPRRR